MVVTIKIGRRVPKGFAKRLIHKTEQIFSLQEQVWLLIVQAFGMAKKAADARPEEQVVITIEKKDESEGLYYQIEWRIIKISSIIKEKELEEYNEVMNIYEKFSILKKHDKKFEDNDDLKKPFKSEVLPEQQFINAKEKGFGAVGDLLISEKLLELGIITDIQKDW